MKNIVEDYLKIDVRRWQRDGLLSSGNFFAWEWLCKNESLAKVAVLVRKGSINLSYRSKSQSVQLVTSACHLGGCRYWFQCGCGKRVAILYAGASRFACRHCLNLNYQTQHLQLHDRLASKAHKLRNRLGWSGGLSDGEGLKPRGMHWRTYKRLSAEAENAVEQCYEVAKAKFPNYEGFG